jgi:hypothetical protein
MQTMQGQHSTRVPGKNVSREKKKQRKEKKNLQALMQAGGGSGTQMQRGGNERSGPWKKSRSQREGMLKLRHMPKSPDPSSTFPRYTKSIFHCSSVPPPMSPASTLPGKFFFFYLRCYFFLLLKLFPSVSHLAALRSCHVAPHPLSAPSKFFSFFLLSCLLLTLVSEHCPCMSPPFVDTTHCTCPHLLLCKSFILFFVVLHLLTLLMPRPSLPHATSLHPCRVPQCCIPQCHIPPASLLRPTPTRCTQHQPPFPRRTSFINVPTSVLLRLTAIRAVVVLYNPKDQQGCQRQYTTRETLATMARKCQRRRRMRMRSKDSSSCARLQAGTLASTFSTVVVVQSGQSEDCPSNCMGYLYN